MHRLWSDTRIYIVTSDHSFVTKTTAALPSHFEVVQIEPLRLPQVPASRLQSALIVWDLTNLTKDRLTSFLVDHPKLARNSSLFLLLDACDTPGLSEILNSGAVDFILRTASASEICLRLEQARRPWVKGMATAFEFLSGLDVDLTMTEQKVFLCFLQSFDFGAARKDIMESVWGNMNVHPNTLDVHLFNIRRKLEPSGIRITFTSAKSCWVLSKPVRTVASEDSAVSEIAKLEPSTHDGHFIS